jgi:homoserine kinase type II
VAVYTDVSDDALTAFLADYPIGRLVAFRGIAEGVENTNFSLRTTEGDFILTLYERRVDPNDLPWFLGLMRHLAERGISCPLPVAGYDGAALRMLCCRHAAITTFLPGVWPRRVTQAHCRPLGEALAQLHLAGSGYGPDRPNGLGPVAWLPLVHTCQARADEVESGLAEELAEAAVRILREWPANLPRGQIHADLFPDNVFFLDGRLSGLIDFYFACTEYFAFDIAVCLNAWCFEPGFMFNASHARALLAGYNSVRPLEDKELSALPVLAQGAALRFLLTRLYDWLHMPPGAIVTPKNPLEYLHRLRFHCAAQDYHAYGL